MAERDDKAAKLLIGKILLSNNLKLWELLKFHELSVATDLTLQNPNLRERDQVKILEKIYGGRPERDQL